MSYEGSGYTLVPSTPNDYLYNGGAGRTWRRWLSEDSTLGADLWNSITSTYLGAAPLLDGNTYVDFYENQKAYWSSSSEDRANANIKS